MEKISFDGLMAPLENRAFNDERSEVQRRAALATLFATLPSQSRAPEERALQLEAFANALEDIAPEVLDVVVRSALKSDKLKWLPSISQLRSGAARVIRRMRHAATGSTLASDYDPERGVMFNPEREITWALRNADALRAGITPRPLRSGMERHQSVFERVTPALVGGSAVPLLSGGPESDAEYFDEPPLDAA